MHNHSRYVLLTPLLLDVIATTGCHVLVWGLYLSALLSSEESSRPPTAYIMLLYTATPRCFLCVPIGDTLVHVFERGSYRSTKVTSKRKIYLITQVEYQPYRKGVFNLSNQLSNFSKNWGVQHNKTEFHEFHVLILTHFSYLHSNMAIIPTVFTGKHVKFFEIS